jgi:hypothetical protein
MLRLRATVTATQCLALAGTAHPQAAAPVDHIARVAAALEPAMQLAGAPPVRHRIEERMRDFKVPG